MGFVGTWGSVVGYVYFRRVWGVLFGTLMVFVCVETYNDGFIPFIICGLLMCLIVYGGQLRFGFGFVKGVLINWGLDVWSFNFFFRTFLRRRLFGNVRGRGDDDWSLLSVGGEGFS